MPRSAEDRYPWLSIPSNRREGQNVDLVLDGRKWPGWAGGRIVGRIGSFAASTLVRTLGNDFQHIADARAEDGEIQNHKHDQRYRERKGGGVGYGIFRGHHA